jgi:hypothetical protein
LNLIPSAASLLIIVLQLPGERSVMKRTFVEDVFDNLKNECGIVGFHLILAWQTNLQSRDNSASELNDIELHIGKYHAYDCFSLLIFCRSSFGHYLQIFHSFF